MAGTRWPTGLERLTSRIDAAIARGTHWEDSPEALLAYIQTKDWKLDYMELSDACRLGMIKVLRDQA